MILVTGATGHIGGEVCRLLRRAKRRILPVDIDSSETPEVVKCDLRLQPDVSRLFQTPQILAVIHLAGVLPTAFLADPLAGVDVNLNGSFELMRQAVSAHVKRFIFASSMSVYGSRAADRALSEADPATPDEPYGASKRVVELVGQTLAHNGAIEFVSVRIARVVGLGIKKTSSPWRSQIFEPPSRAPSICIPFAPEATLSLVHVQDVARMLVALVEAAHIRSSVYNTPAETWKVRLLRETIEEIRGIPVTLADSGVEGGPLCDGRRFEQEFNFQLRGLRDRLRELH